jgi:ankyrin repeat protein
MTGIEENTVRINLAELLSPFQKLGSVDVSGARNGQPTEAFTLLKNKNFDDLKELVLREPRNLTIKNFGQSIVDVAAEVGDLKFVKFLAKQAPWLIKEKTHGGWTPAHYAAGEGHLPVVQYLIENVPGIVNEKTNCGTLPVHLAAVFQKWDTFRFLAHHNPSTLNMKDNNKKTVLDEARRRGASEALMQELESLAVDAADRDQKSE